MADYDETVPSDPVMRKLTMEDYDAEFGHTPLPHNSKVEDLEEKLAATDSDVRDLRLKVSIRCRCPSLNFFTPATSCSTQKSSVSGMGGMCFCL